MNIDKSKKEFDKFKNNFDQYKNKDISESDTRSKLLDELLKSVLGWHESDILREGHSNAGYYDYKIVVPGFNFVIEAKRNFDDFKLPVKHKTATLNSLLKGNKDVIEQIRNYLFEEGLQYGIISNGHQFIIAKFINSDGTSWKSNKATLFNGVNDIEKRFIDFFNLFSRLAVVENTGFNIEVDSFKGKSIYSNLPNPNKELIRNSLSGNITPLLDSVFGEIFNNDFMDDEALIKECFIANEEIKKNRSEIERLFSDNPPNLEEVIPAINTENIFGQIETEIEGYPISLKNIPPPKPIIIVGSKGAGKTTFINYLFKYAFSEEFLKKRPIIYLDIRKYTESDLKLGHKKIYQDLIKKLYEDFESLELHKREKLIRIYIKEIKRRDDGDWAMYDRKSSDYENALSDFLTRKLNDPETHFSNISEYLIRERRMRICTIFDNADQLDVNIQKAAFLFAQSINNKAKCSVILSLREGYYYRYRDKTPFNAYFNHVYHITAPPYGEVLQRRIDYALNHIKLTGKVRGSINLFSGSDMELNKQGVIDFLSSARNTLFKRQNSEMLEFLSSSTFPNIREGLRLFKRFLISGHTQVDKYLIRQHSNPNSVIPIPVHEFVKAIALDNKIFYNSEISIVKNLFKPSDNNTNHFLKIKLLRYLFNYSKGSPSNEKFILASHVVDSFEQFAYKRSVVFDELLDLYDIGMIETQDLLSDTDESAKLSLDDTICITLKGYYYVTKLICKFFYIGLVAEDTPIFHQRSFDEMSETFSKPGHKGQRRLNERLEFVESFIKYLQFSEQQETLEGDIFDVRVMNYIRNNGLNKEIEIIRSKVK